MAPAAPFAYVSLQDLKSPPLATTHGPDGLAPGLSIANAAVRCHDPPVFAVFHASRCGRFARNTSPALRGFLDGALIRTGIALEWLGACCLTRSGFVSPPYPSSCSGAAPLSSTKSPRAPTETPPAFRTGSRVRRICGRAAARTSSLILATHADLQLTQSVARTPGPVQRRRRQRRRQQSQAKTRGQARQATEERYGEGSFVRRRFRRWTCSVWRERVRPSWSTPDHAWRTRPARLAEVSHVFHRREDQPERRLRALHHINGSRSLLFSSADHFASNY